MKKFLAFFVVALIASNSICFAQEEAFITEDGCVVIEEKTPSKFKTAINRIRVKKYAKRFVKAKAKRDNLKAKDELSKFFEYGGENTQIKLYSPCPCRGEIQINGKFVDAKSKHCAVMDYKIGEKSYQVGSCKKVKKKNVEK